MGKSSKKKIQKESRAKPLLKDKPLEAEETSVKWSSFRNPFFHLILITIIGLIAYSNTFTVPFHFDDTPNIVENYKIKDISNFWPPSGSRWFGFLTFALNYHLGGLDTTGYHIVNLTIHILNAILIYWLVVLTLRTPYFKVSAISASVSNQPNQFNLSTFKPLNYLPLFIALLFVSHPIQTQAVTYIVQRFTSLATLFYLLSLVMYIGWRLMLEQQSNRPIGQKKNTFFLSFLRKQESRHRPCENRELKQETLDSRFHGNDREAGRWLYSNYRSAALLLYCASVISAILAMKTKEISFTLPFIIILYEFCFLKSQNHELRTTNLRRLLYLMPFLLTLFIIPLSIVGIDKPVGDAIGELREATQATEEIPRWGYLFTQFRVIVTYIRLLFLPINQNLDYDYPVYDSFLNLNVFLSFLFLLSILILGIYLLYRSRHTTNLQNSNSEHQMLSIPTRYTLHPTPYPLYATRLTAFGIFWFFITLSVESSIIPIRDVIFEHRLYLPSVGIIIVFSTAVFYVASNLIAKSANRKSSLRGALATKQSNSLAYERLLRLRLAMTDWIKATAYPLLITAVVVFSIVTYYRNLAWQDEVSLWKDVVRKSPNKARGYNNLGMAYGSKGLNDKTIEYCQIALRLKPDYTTKAMAYYNLGLAYHYKGLTDEAMEHFLVAIRLKPDYADAHNNLGVAYLSKGLIDKAIEHYQIVLKLRPDYAETHNNLGIVYEKKGFLDEAIKEYHTALQINPEFKLAMDNLNRILQIKRQ